MATAKEKKEGEALEELMRVMGALPGIAALFGEGEEDVDVLTSIGKIVGKPKRGASTRYYDQMDQETTSEEWKRLMSQGAQLAIYQNHKIRVRLVWLGINEKANTVPLDQAELWKVQVCDRIVVTDDITGEEREKFVESGNSTIHFSDRDKARGYYNRQVESWTKSYIDDDGKLHEVDNELAPPDPDKPSAASAPPDDVW